MTTNETPDSQKPVSQRSGRYSFVSPGRQAAAKALHARGLAGMGGRRPKHGRRALVELLRRGMEEGTEIATLQRELTDAYLADLGGEQNVSNMDKGLVKRMVVADLDLALLLAQRDGATKLSREQLIGLSQALSRNTANYTQLVKTLGGPGRRQVETDREVIVRRYQADPGAAKPDNGQEEQGARAAAGSAQEEHKT